MFQTFISGIPLNKDVYQFKYWNILQFFFCFEKDKEEHPKDPQMLDLADLTDDELKAMLLKHGIKAGPIVGKLS